MRNITVALPATEYTKAERFIIIVMIVSAFLTLWATLYTPIYDGDIWFHLLYGKSILENHTLIPDHTIYSWTPSTNDQIYCAWIGQVFYYLLYEYTGDSGIIVFRYFAASTLFLALIYLTRKQKTFNNPIVWFSATLCILITDITILDKPELISFVLMVLTVLNWYQIKRLTQRTLFYIYLFPLLILIWVNTHGVFVFGCIFLFCVGLGETINQLFYPQNGLPRRMYLHLLLALGLSAGCTLVTPYGYDYLYQLITSFFDTQDAKSFSYVNAFLTTFDSGDLRLTVFANTAICLILFVFVTSLRKRQLDFVPIISNLVFGFLFTRYLRTTYLWLPVFSLSIAYYVSAMTFVQLKRRKIFLVFFMLAGFFLSSLIIYQAKYFPSKERWLSFGLSESTTIDEEVEFIQENFPTARLGNFYDHGAYILWKMWPQTKVMIDARYFPYKNIFLEHMMFERGRNVEAYILNYPFEVIELKHSAIALMQWFLISKDWQLAFYGKGAVIFVRMPLESSVKLTRGESLNNFLNYETGLRLFQTTLKIKDWRGTDIVLATMKRTFRTNHQQKVIDVLELIKLAAQAYDQKDYTASIQFMEEAIAKDMNDPDLYAAALLMKANEDWRNNKKNAAIKNAIKSFQVKKSFVASYDVAIMAWKIETNQTNNEILSKNILTDNEKEFAAAWRETLEIIVENKDKLLPQYVQFAENAKNILSGNTVYFAEPIEPDWR